MITGGDSVSNLCRSAYMNFAWWIDNKTAVVYAIYRWNRKYKEIQKCSSSRKSYSYIYTYIYAYIVLRKIWSKEF